MTPTASTKTAASPALKPVVASSLQPTPSAVLGDDEVSSVDDLQGMSLVRDEVEQPSSRTSRFTSAAGAIPQASPAFNDVLDLGSLGRGDSVGLDLGGKVSADGGVAGATIKGEVKRREDGKFDIKVTGKGFAGMGGDQGIVKAELGFVTSESVTLVAESAEEARVITAELAAAIVVGANPVLTTSAAAAFLAAQGKNIEEARIGIGLGASLGLEVGNSLEDVGFEVGGDVVGELVYRDGAVSMDIRATIDGGADFLGHNHVGFKGLEGEAVVVIHIPLGSGSKSAGSEAALTAQASEALKAGAVTMSLEAELSGPNVAVTVEKEIEGNRLADLLVDVDVTVFRTNGFNLKGQFPGAEGEVGLHRKTATRSWSGVSLDGDDARDIKRETQKHHLVLAH